MSAIRLIDRPHKIRYWILVALRSLTGLGDIAGVVLLGTVGILLSDEDDDRALTLLRFFNLDSLERPTQIVFLCSAALLIFIVKGAGATAINYLIFRTLGRAELSLGERILTTEVSSVSSRSSDGTIQQTSFDLTSGLLAATTRLLGFLGVAVGELTSLVALTVLMIMVDPLIATVAFSFFGLTGALIHFMVAARSRRHGQRLSASTVESMEIVHNALALSREIRLSESQEQVLRSYRSSRIISINSNAILLSLSTVPRHIVEVSLILGIGLMALVSYVTLPTGEASVSVGLFALIGARLTPAVLAAQGAIAAMSVAVGEGSGVLSRRMIEEPSSRQSRPGNSDHRDISPPSISLDSVSLNLGQNPILQNISFSLEAGTITGIVGFSGSGKSTLLDVILGLIRADGLVLADGHPIPDYLAQHPQSIAYVPQQPVILRGTVSENVALYQPHADFGRVAEVLATVGLEDLAEDIRVGKDEKIGSLGRELSGGEAQKLSIARAIYGFPSLLVLDEPTSSLDRISEKTIVDLINSFRNTMTVIMTAHRYQSVADCDQLVWIHSGRLKMIGPPSEIIDLISHDSSAREL